MNKEASHEDTHDRHATDATDRASASEDFPGVMPSRFMMEIRVSGGKQPNIPLIDSAAFKKAARESSGETNLDLPF
jgi:hypothetical protein